MKPPLGNDPAFPVVTKTMGFCPGLTKREWLAAQFMQAFIIGAARPDSDPEHPMRYNFEEMFSDGTFATTFITRRGQDGKDYKMSIGEVWASESWNLCHAFLDECKVQDAEWRERQQAAEEEAAAVK